MFTRLACVPFIISTRISKRLTVQCAAFYSRTPQHDPPDDIDIVLVPRSLEHDVHWRPGQTLPISGQHTHAWSLWPLQHAPKHARLHRVQFYGYKGNASWFGRKSSWDWGEKWPAWRAQGFHQWLNANGIELEEETQTLPWATGSLFSIHVW